MNPSLLLGIIIGMGAVLFCFGVFLALPARRMSKAGTTFNEKSLAELTERNTIGHEQLAALWKIAGYLAPRDTRAADRKARRERIAVAAFQHIPVLIDAMDETPSYWNIARHSIEVADQLIAELDKDEP